LDTSSHSSNGSIVAIGARSNDNVNEDTVVYSTTIVAVGFVQLEPTLVGKQLEKLLVIRWLVPGMGLTVIVGAINKWEVFFSVGS